MERKELLGGAGYWIANIQIDLFNHCEEYLKKNKLTRTQFAEKLGVTKGYISQVLNGDFDHRISKLVELSLAIGKVPVIEFKDLEQVIEDDKKKKPASKYNKPEKSLILIAKEKKTKYKNK